VGILAVILWLLGVVQLRAVRLSLPRVLRRQASPDKPEFVDTEASWHAR
jgi:hypothetical protein